MTQIPETSLPIKTAVMGNDGMNILTQLLKVESQSKTSMVQDLSSPSMFDLTQYKPALTEDILELMPTPVLISV
jgi:hypothetical protein